MAIKPADQIASLDELYQAFDGLHMEGGWHRVKPALWREQAKNFLPWRWRYSEVKPILDAAGRLIDTEKAERRNLTMTNPVEGNLYPTVRTIVAAYQMVRPGEVARAHRHTPNALRLILEGRGTYTVVDGHEVEMRPGDVLLTPNWAWHSHQNKGGEDCYWMDFLDVPLVHLLEPMFYEPHPDGVEKDVVALESAPIAFRREDTLARLDAQAKAHATVELTPEPGKPALRSIALHMHKLAAGAATARTRTTANNIYAVTQGSGRTEIDGQSFEWAFGDTISVPAWRPYRHHADSEAVLLQVTDAPLLDAMGWLRTEQLD